MALTRTLTTRPPWLAAALLAAALVAAACQRDDSSSASSSSASPTTAEAGPLDGVWRTVPITPAETEATLEALGLGEWVDEFRPLNPVEAPSTELVLDIGDDWDLYRQVDGTAREEVDYDAEYVVDGDEVEVIHSSGSRTARWAIADDGTLTFDFVRSDIPPSQGVPEEVFHAALYETVPFTRDR